MPRSLRRPVFFCTLSLGLLVCVDTDAAPAKAKAKAPSKTAAKKAAQKPVLVQGVRVEGSGSCAFKASFSKGSSNSLATPFTAVERDKRDYAVSSCRALSNKEVTTVINLIYGPIEKIGDLQRQRSLTMTFASRRGLRAGQTFQIAAPQSGRPTQTQACIMDLTENEQSERETTRPSGRKTTKKTRQSRSWLCVSGTARITSISQDALFFTISNARFVVPKGIGANNYAEGAFTMNASGSSTFESS